MKKLLTLFVTLMCATSIFAYDCQIDGIYYNLRYGNTAEVTYRKNRAKNYSGVVIIPSTITYKGQNYSVTSIGKEAFCNSLGLTSVTIPNSVTRIEEGAFSCTSLTSITIPNSVTAIERYVLSHCLKLTSVTIPNSVTRIEEGAFYGCEKLATISIPNSVTSIGEKAFGWCEKLTSIEIPPSVTYIWKDAFFQCPMLKSVVINSNKIVTGFDKTEIFGEQVQKYIIGDSVTTIDGFAFNKCSNLKSITIPNSVTSIGSFDFSDCSSLTSVNIGNSVTTIGQDAFEYCSGLTSVNIGNSVTTMEWGAFYNCNNLTKTNYTGTIADWCGIEFEGLANPIQYSHNFFINDVEVKDLIIPNSVTTIGEDAFHYCSGLTSVTIPTSVTSIEKDAFSFCGGLKTVTILSTNIKIDDEAFAYCSIDNLYCPKTIAINKNEHIKNIHYLTDDEIIFLTPFSAYAQHYVESHINEWQKKGDFEKVADWQKRVNETTRKQKTNEFLKEAKKKYLSVYATKSRSFTLGAYDTENEVYLVKEKDLGDLLVPIPINEAQYVQQNWENCKTSPKYDIHGTEVVVTSVGFTFPNKKTYTYKPSQNLTYAQADIQYNFDPIELNLGSNTSSTQPKDNKLFNKSSSQLANQK